jgi:hypothetical protein
MPEASPTGTEEHTALLQSRLGNVIRDHAQFRLAAQWKFSQMESRLREQELRLQENDRYIHQLHTERDLLKQAVASARADVEGFTQLLAQAEVKVRHLETAKRSSLWWFVEPLFNFARKLAAKTDGSGADLPSLPFTYFLHTSPFRIYRGDNFTLRGWVLPPAGRTISAIRVRIDQSEYAARLDLDEPDVVRAHQLDAKARPGFEVEFSLPSGKHRLRLEVCLDHSEWVSVLNTWAWSLAPAGQKSS